MLRLSISASVLLGLVVLGPTRAAAADAPQGVQGRDWAEIAQLPDFSGSWELFGFVAAQRNKEVTPFKPSYQKVLDENRAIIKRGGDIPSNTKLCIPTGLDSVMEAPGRVYEFLFQPGEITIIPQDNYVRHIYTDGRKRTDHPKLSFNGESLGHWEGQVLVVETAALLPEGEFIHGVRTGPASADMRIVERFYLADKDKLRVDTTMYSDVAFTKPYTRTMNYRRVPFPVAEEICTQNNRELDAGGNQIFNTTPPPLKN